MIRFVSQQIDKHNYSKLYNLTEAATGTFSKLYPWYIESIIRPEEGMKFLDLGCGTGSIVSFLPKGEYRGLDNDKARIKLAQKRYGHLAEFDYFDFSNNWPEGIAQNYDVVMANGVIHHLNDEQTKNLLNFSHYALKGGGRFVSFDGVRIKNQSWFRKAMLDLDRGKFVRTADEYIRLIGSVYSGPQFEIKRDLLRVPYDLIFFTCKK